MIVGAILAIVTERIYEHKVGWQGMVDKCTENLGKIQRLFSVITEGP